MAKRKYIVRARSWPTPIPPLSMNCWSIWRGQTCRSKAIGCYGTKEYPRGDPVRAQYWGDSRKQRPQTRPMTPCSEYLQVKMCRLKGRLCDSLHHTAASTLRFFFLLHLVCFIDWGFWRVYFFISILQGCCKCRQRLWRDREMKRIGCIMSNPQRINFKQRYGVEIGIPNRVINNQCHSRNK